MSESTDRVSARWHLRNADIVPYTIAGVLIIGLSVYLSLQLCSWTWLSRSGGIVILLGVMLGFRRLFRFGAGNLSKEDQPLVVRGNQFNTIGMWQRVERLTDGYALALGLGFIIIGTMLAAYGDEIAELYWPILIACTA